MSIDDMKIPDPWTCRDCRNFQRCQGLISIKGDETTCDWGPSRFQLDAIGVLGRLLEKAGATLTLYGKPVTVDQVRHLGNTLAEAKIAAKRLSQEALPLEVA